MLAQRCKSVNSLKDYALRRASWSSLLPQLFRKLFFQESFQHVQLSRHAESTAAVVPAGLVTVAAGGRSWYHLCGAHFVGMQECKSYRVMEASTEILKKDPGDQAGSESLGWPLRG